MDFVFETYIDIVWSFALSTMAGPTDNEPSKHTTSFRCPYNIHNVKTTPYGCQNNVVCVLGILSIPKEICIWACEYIIFSCRNLSQSQIIIYKPIIDISIPESHFDRNVPIQAHKECKQNWRSCQECCEDLFNCAQSAMINFCWSLLQVNNNKMVNNESWSYHEICNSQC